MKSQPLPAPLTARAVELRDRYILAVVLLLTAITFLGTLRFGFVSDDSNRIYSNPLLKSWQYLPQYFTASAWKQTGPSALNNDYRPLTLLWDRLSYAAFALRPAGWHFTAVLLHLFVTWLVYLVVRKMTGRINLAWLTALIFGVHPIHHDSVAWISGASESLLAALFLASFLAYLSSRQSSKSFWMAVSCGFYGFALLSRETAIILPVLVFAYDWIEGASDSESSVSPSPNRTAQSLLRIAPYIPVALVYLVARYEVLGSLMHNVAGVSFTTWLLTLPSVLMFYLKNWFVPIHLSEFYDLPYQTHFGLAHVVAPALLVMAVACLVWVFRVQLGSRTVAKASAWLVIPLLPVLNIFLTRPDELVHDRYFYLPSIGAALLVALVLERVGQGSTSVFGQPVRVLASALALAVVLALCTIRATSFWSDDFTLSTRAHEIAPQNSSAANDLSAQLIDRGELEQAQSLLENRVHAAPQDYRFAVNLGRALYLKKNYSLAEQYTLQAVALNPNAAAPYVSLGEIQLKQNRAADAESSMRRAVELSPENPQYHTVFGIVLELNGNCPQAMIQFKAAEAISPGNFFTQREMARCGSNASPAPASASQAKPH